MSIKVMSEVWEHSTHKGAALLLMLAIADHANDDGIAWPSRSRMASRIRMSVMHTRRLIRTLIKSGELIVIHPGGSGPGDPSKYQIDLRGSPAIVRGSPAIAKGIAGVPGTTINHHRTTINHHQAADAAVAAAAVDAVKYWSTQTGQTPMNGQVAQLRRAVELVGEAVVRELVDWAAGRGYTDTGRILKAATKRAAGQLAAAPADSDAEAAWRVVSRYATRPTAPAFDDGRIRAITARIWPITKAQFVAEWQS